MASTSAVIDIVLINLYAPKLIDVNVSSTSVLATFSSIHEASFVTFSFGIERYPW